MQRSYVYKNTRSVIDCYTYDANPYVCTAIFIYPYQQNWPLTISGIIGHLIIYKSLYKYNTLFDT